MAFGVAEIFLVIPSAGVMLNSNAGEGARDAIKRFRRRPEKCLYCDDTPTTDEHVLPRAIGGRLAAPILCDKHNSAVSAADKALCEWFAPLTWILAIRRQDGKIGTSFNASDVNGVPCVVTTDGRIEQKNRILEYDNKRRIVRAKGNLKWLDRLRERSSAFAASMPVMALPEISAPVAVTLGLTDEAWPGLIKIAVHFVAGFLGHVTVDEPLMRILLENEPPAPAEYLRSIPYTQDTFGDERPPRHDIAAFPGRDATYVSMFLFGIFPMVVRVPCVVSAPALRYTQTFDGAGPVLAEVAPATIRWEEAMNDTESSEFLSGLDRRMQSIYEDFQRSEHEDMCIEAARRAIEATRSMAIGFIDAFRAELQLYSWPTERIDEAVNQTRQLLSKKLCPWEFPLTTERSPGWRKPTI